MATNGWTGMMRDMITTVDLVGPTNSVKAGYIDSDSNNSDDYSISFSITNEVGEGGLIILWRQWGRYKQLQVQQWDWKVAKPSDANGNYVYSGVVRRTMRGDRDSSSTTTIQYNTIPSNDLMQQRQYSTKLSQLNAKSKQLQTISATAKTNSMKLMSSFLSSSNDNQPSSLQQLKLRKNMLQTWIVDNLHLYHQWGTTTTPPPTIATQRKLIQMESNHSKSNISADSGETWNRNDYNIMDKLLHKQWLYHCIRWYASSSKRICSNGTHTRSVGHDDRRNKFNVDTLKIKYNSYMVSAAIQQ